MSNTTTQQNNSRAIKILVLAAMFMMVSAIVYFQSSVNPEVANLQTAEIKVILMKIVSGCMFAVAAIMVTDKSILGLFTCSNTSNNRLTRIQ